MCIDRLTETEDIAGLTHSKAELQEVQEGRPQDNKMLELVMLAMQRRLVQPIIGHTRSNVWVTKQAALELPRMPWCSPTTSLGFEAGAETVAPYTPPETYVSGIPDLPGQRRSRGDMYPEKSLGIPTMS